MRVDVEHLMIGDLKERLSPRKAVARSSVARSRRFRWRGAVGGVLLVPAVAVALFSRPVVPESSWLDLALDAMGWALFVAGAMLRFWATLYIGGRKQVAVVADGPYSVCRNPLYVGSLLLAFGAGLLLKSLVFAGALLAVGIAYTLATVPAEEEYLRAKLGPEYDAYRHRVPAYIPSWRQFCTPQRIEVDVHSLRLEAARASRWIWVPLLAHAISQFRAQSWWPHLFNLP